MERRIGGLYYIPYSFIVYKQKPFSGSRPENESDGFEDCIIVILENAGVYSRILVEDQIGWTYLDNSLFAKAATRMG